MIYVFGMSHAINVLKAISKEPLSFTHENWSALTEAGQFFDIEAKPELISGEAIKAFIASPGIGWGLVAELRTLPDGQKVLAAVDGYINLLHTLDMVQDGNVLFSFIHGNEHSLLAQHAVPYDFHLPWQDGADLLPRTQPVPYEVIRCQMERALNNTIACLAMMRIHLPRMRLVHVLPPPPVGSRESILKTPEGFREKLEQFGISPISLRVKYYLLVINILRHELKPSNIEFLESPPEAVSEIGALKDEYAYAATHANEAYGELVAKQMQALVSSKG